MSNKFGDVFVVLNAVMIRQPACQSAKLNWNDF